jgi:hypothetical protein
MTRTEKRIQNLMIRRGELIAEVADRTRRHMPRSDQERELRFVTAKMIRLETHEASRCCLAVPASSPRGNGGSPDVGGTNALT